MTTEEAKKEFLGLLKKLDSAGIGVTLWGYEDGVGCIEFRSKANWHDREEVTGYDLGY